MAGGIKRKGLHPVLSKQLPYSFNIVVNAADVTAGTITRVVETKKITFAVAAVYTAGDPQVVKAWDGVITLTAGTLGSQGTSIAIDNAGAVDWADTDVIVLNAYEAELS